jgi:hypothetical protein
LCLQSKKERPTFQEGFQNIYIEVDRFISGAKLGACDGFFYVENTGFENSGISPHPIRQNQPTQ